MYRLLQKKLSGVVLTILIVFALATPIFSQTTMDSQPPRSPEKGISITLAVYSGRTNPQWWLTSDSTVRQITTLIDTLRITTDPLFDYDKWNRLGYAGFWVEAKGFDKLPRAIHIWRDMAYVVMDKRGKTGHAINATELYKFLVEQAEERNLGSFFENYRKLPEGSK